MKAKQLMIGDLIYTRDINAKNYIRITAIDGAANFIRGIYLNNNEDTGWFSCDLAYEIKLTAEILKANSSVESKYNSRILKYISDDFRLEFEIYRNKTSMLIEIINKETLNSIFMQIYPCIYVHQLQHALRLCNLNDIADNFKLPQL